MYSELYFTLTVLLLMLLFVQSARAQKRRNPGIYRYTLRLTAFIYLCGVVYFTAIRGPRTNLGGARLRIMLPILWIIRDRRYINNAIVHFLNILMFVPFGYLLPQFRRLSWRRVVLSGFLFSLLIETSQLIFRFGVFQTDDLIDNTLGAGLGYLLYYILNLRRET